MKINGLNNNDFEWIDNAFRFLMSSQAKQIKEAVECGSPEMIRDNIEPLEEVLKVYEKVQKEIRKYEGKATEAHEYLSKAIKAKESYGNVDVDLCEDGTLYINDAETDEQLAVFKVIEED